MKGIKVSNDINSMGTHLVGNLDTTYDELVKAFGNPNFDDISGDDKVKIEWCIMFKDGTIATIYDWKNYEISNSVVKDKNRDWHIGGNDEKAVEKVVQWMNKKGVAFCQM